MFGKDNSEFVIFSTNLFKYNIIKNPRCKVGVFALSSLMKKQHIFERKIFSLFCENNHDSKKLVRLLYERFEVESHDYEDDEIWTLVEKYFINTVIPHKIEVRKAGMEFLKESWFIKLLSLADNNTKDPIEQFKYNLWVHDLSKFSLQEAYGYAIHDFKNPKTTYSLFQKAWHHHKLYNPHHPEYWLSVERSGATTPIPMPSIYVAEMIADWIGASKSYGMNFQEWLPKNLPQFTWHPYTANLAAEYLSMMGFRVRKEEQKLYLE
ncbi:hypothetical protein Emtol_1161 [Emticicia oligotrophica DSM 17448]|uniref:Uncharacterized protein n=2 Tax=Emticicia TaxID=312278 RepID=A0ABN4AKG4_EMTOG|nr:hypothetical protein Emtol_1161 [Emticicia oligotrophica DSM 17448]